MKSSGEGYGAEHRPLYEVKASGINMARMRTVIVQQKRAILNDAEERPGAA